MDRNKYTALLGFVFLGLTLLVNALANVLPINNLNTGEVSALYPSLFTPAALTFSIWTVIYLLLLGFVVFAWARRTESIFQEVLPWFIATCVVNMLWILAWHFLLVAVSVALMVVLLALLIKIFLILQTYTPRDIQERLFLQLPFVLYFGWICVATIANISALLVSLHWAGGPIAPETWTLIMMAIASLLAFIITERYRVPAFALVVMWALFGIYLKWRQSAYADISNAAIILIVVLAGTIVHAVRKSLRMGDAKHQ